MPRLLVIEVTSAVDGVSHRVRQQIHDEALSSDTGHYPALCGTTVLAAALITQPGPACRLCLEAVKIAQR